MKPHEFDEKFDAGADVSGDVYWDKALRPNLAYEAASMSTVPPRGIDALDREARRLGVTRQALHEALDRRTARAG